MYAFGSVTDVSMNWSSGCPALVADSLRVSRSGPTFPVVPAGVNVWHEPQLYFAKTALPAAGSPVGFGAVALFTISCASACSRPKTTTALIIARKKTTQRTMYQLRHFPGKFGS